VVFGVFKIDVVITFPPHSSIYWNDYCINTAQVWE